MDLVEEQVRAYEERQAQKPLLYTLTEVALEEQVQQGKVDFNERLNDNSVNLAAAQSTALQAFEDGLYVIFADEEQLTTLEQSVDWLTVQAFSFLRLTFLSGRRW